MIKYTYYHQQVRKNLSFLIPPHKKILLFCSGDGSLLNHLSPSLGTGIETEPRLYQRAREKYPQMKFLNHQLHQFKVKGKFDYIILYGALGKTQDICQLLTRLQKNCHASTRLLVYQQNHLWQPIINLAERFQLKRPEGVLNWLSVSDLSTYLKATGFEKTRVFRHHFFPLYLEGIGRFLNELAMILPLFDWLKLDQYILARPQNSLIARYTKAPSLTICITVRDEEKNIELITRSLPQVCPKQEIMFVEGHSRDNTRAEIRRMIKKYPSKNVRLVIQPGIGQGDATRVGFKKARGDIIIIYEGDGTAEPGDIKYFYEAMRTGRFEFIGGSRFIYPLSSQTMPLLNQLGNMFFAAWFSFFLNQNVTDVLCGIKAINRQDYQQVYKYWNMLSLTDPFGDFNLLFSAARMGLHIGEIPAKYYPRQYGETKTKPFHHGPYLLRMALQGYKIFRCS